MADQDRYVKNFEYEWMDHVIVAYQHLIYIIQVIPHSGLR